MKWFGIRGSCLKRKVSVRWMRKDEKGKELWLKIKIGDDVWKGVVVFDDNELKGDKDE